MTGEPLARLRGVGLAASRLHVVLWVYVSVSVLAALAAHQRGAKTFDGVEHTHYNNFLIFKHSSLHLLEGRDLYVTYPKEHWDYYKYSPTFAVLFTPIAVLPDLAGLVAWNLVNALALFLGVRALRTLDAPAKAWVLWFALVELLTSLQNAQSNGLLAGLTILAFAALEAGRPGASALAVAGAFFVKPFGALAGLLATLFPRWGAFASLGAAAFVTLGLLPFAVASPAYLMRQHGDWLRLLARDHATYYGTSVYGVVHEWLDVAFTTTPFLLVGLLALLLPLARTRAHSSPSFRLLVLASVLIWMVVFNHKAESPTYVIAISGVALWYVAAQRTRLDLVLLVAAFVMTSLSPTDVFPDSLKARLGEDTVKALPCILVWLRIQQELLFGRWDAPPAGVADRRPA